MGRREQAAELRSTWMVLEARVPGRPFSRKDIDDAEARAAAERARSASAVVFQSPLLEAPEVSVRTYLPALARAAR